MLKGQALPDGSLLTALSAPIGNVSYSLAFTGKTNTGINGAWWGFAAQDASAMTEYFRLAGPAPSADGGVWKKL